MRTRVGWHRPKVIILPIGGIGPNCIGGGRRSSDGTELYCTLLHLRTFLYCTLRFVLYFTVIEYCTVLYFTVQLCRAAVPQDAPCLGLIVLTAPLPSTQLHGWNFEPTILFPNYFFLPKFQLPRIGAVQRFWRNIITQINKRKNKLTHLQCCLQNSTGFTKSFHHLYGRQLNISKCGV